MSEVYFSLMLMGLVLLLLRAAWTPARILEYPYIVAAVFVIFIVPQAISLMRFPGRVSDTAVDGALLMCCLCLLAAVVGYRFSPSLTVLRRLAVPVDSTRILHVGLCFIITGYIATYAMVRTDRQFSTEGGMTGIATIYLFFANLIFPGFAICLMLLMQKFTWPRLFATVAGSVVPIINVISIRREPTAMLMLTIVLSVFYVRRRPPPRAITFGAILFATLFIPATGSYRSMFGEGRLEEARSYDLIGNFRDFINQESILELRNAAAVIESTQRFSSYDFGAGYWNQLIFRYVPAQFVGMETKNSLMIGTTVQQMLAGRTEAGFEFNTGSTVTGMGDAFQHFGWFGCLFFMVLGFFFRSVWLASLQPNALFAQLLYMLICTSATRAITHQTVDFLPGLLYHLTFLSIGIWYAKSRPARQVRRRR